MSYRNYHLSKDPTPASRFSSLGSTSTSTSSYRPLYGSGSYRSPRSATTLSASSTVSSFISRYSNLSIDKDKEQGCERAKEDERRKQRELREKERVKERDREKERLIETSKKLEAQIKESKPTPLRKSTLIAVKYGSTKEISSSEDPSTKGPQSSRTTADKSKKDNAPPVTFTTRYSRVAKRDKSREPSPVLKTASSNSLTRPRQRDPSPVAGLVTESIRSRDTSPTMVCKRTDAYAMTIADKFSGAKLPKQAVSNEYRKQSSRGLAFVQSRARSRDPSPTVRSCTSRESSPMEPRYIELANKMIATAARSRDPSPTSAHHLKYGQISKKEESELKHRFTSSITINPCVRQQDTSAAQPRKNSISVPVHPKLPSRDPSPADKKRSTLRGRMSKPETEGTKSLTLSNAGKKTRDPSPALSVKVCSKDSSPAALLTSTSRASRSSSPVESVRDKYGLGGSGPRRSYVRSNSGLGAINRFGVSASPIAKSPIADIALSYMTSSEAKTTRATRPLSRFSLNSESHRSLQCYPPVTSSQVFSAEPQSCVQATESKQESSPSSEITTTEDSSEENENSLKQEPKIFIEISLVTRATSPTRPGTNPLIRTRRTEIGKTVETTIRKQLLPVETADKQMQSDRMDDSTRYLRYNQPVCRSWSPFFDSKEGAASSTTPFYTRYSSNPSKYNRDTLSLSRETSVSSTKSGTTEKHELSKLAARVKDLSLSTQNSSKSTASTSTNSSRPRTLLKQNSPEKPPAVPIKDGIVSIKSVANKDFRKSALNMGPASERPCKSSSASSSSSSSCSSSLGACTAAQTGMTKDTTSIQIHKNGISARSSLSPSCEDTSGSSNTETDLSSTDTDREQSLVRTSSVGPDESQNTTNNELLMRAIQLATNFVMNQNREVPERCYENTSTEQYLQSDLSGKAGWEAGTHYMESIKDDSSDQDDVEPGQYDGNKDDEGKSVLQRMIWWRKSDNNEQHSPKQEDTIQESLPSVRNFCYRIQRVESGEKPWWLSEETKPEGIQETSEEKAMSCVSASLSRTSESEAGDGRSTVTSLFDTQAPNSFHPIQVTRIESGEKAWWMNSSDNLSEKVDTQQNSEASCEAPTLTTCNSSDSNGKKSAGFIVCTLEAEDEAWWEEAITGLKRKDSTSGSSSASVSREPSHEPTPEPRHGQMFRVSHVRSGDKAWWLYSSDNEEKTQPKTEHTSKSDFVQECSPVKAKPFKITRIESGEQPWWMLETSEGPLLSRSGSKLNSNSINNSKKGSGQTSPTTYRITHVESGEKAWWMMPDSSDNLADSPRKLSTFAEKHGEEETSLHVFENEAQIGKELQNETNKASGLPKFPIGEYAAEMLGQSPPLGHRASPEGIEDSGPRLVGRVSPYDNIPSAVTTADERFLASGTVGSSTNIGVVPRKDNQCQSAFISHLTNIDDLLGKSCHPLSPIMDQMFIMDGGVQEIAPEDVRVHDSTPHFIDYCSGAANRVQQIDRTAMLDDAALQVYKDGDYGAYLDLESSLAEQSEDVEDLNSNRKNSLLIRTQLSVRVHSIIEKLLSSEGRELRRLLFSLKQIFQEDKDLVHGFVAHGGLSCLVQIGNDADQNYQNYILRALGQVMLYVDGMNGVMSHSSTVQWLYSLIASRYRLVVKTALKLLLVFIEYCEGNCYLLVSAIRFVDTASAVVPWSKIMCLLKDYENGDTELLIYATSLINKTLSGLSDQDSFYDESDFLEQQGMEGIIQRYMSRSGTDLDLLDQLQLYENVLRFEDGESDGIRIPDNTVRKTLRYRATTGNDTTDRRKSRRHSTGTTPVIDVHPHVASFTPSQAPSSAMYSTCSNGLSVAPPPPPLPPPVKPVQIYGGLQLSDQRMAKDEDSSSSANSGEHLPGSSFHDPSRDTNGVTPGLRRRRERAERQKSLMREQQELENFHNEMVAQGEEVSGNGYIGPQSGIYCKSNEWFPNGASTIHEEGSHHRDVERNLNTVPVSPHKQPNPTTSEPYGTGSGSATATMPRQFHAVEYRNSRNVFLHKHCNSFTNSALSNDVTTYDRWRVDLNENVRSTRSPTSSLPEQDTENKNPNINLQTSYIRHLSNGKELSDVSGNRRPALLGFDKGTGSMTLNGTHFEMSLGLNRQPIQESDNEEKKLIRQLKKDHTVKDLTQKLTSMPLSPQDEKRQNHIGDMSGLISKAKEGLAKSKSNKDISRSPSVDSEIKKLGNGETKKSENELHWEEIVKNMSRKLSLCDLDFTDLTSEDDKDLLAPRGFGGVVPPPPPPGGMLKNGMPPPPNMILPSPKNLLSLPGGLINVAGVTQLNTEESSVSTTIKKNKKTVKLFWKEVRDDMIPTTLQRTIWDELPEAVVDTQKLEHLFESRAKDLLTKKQHELNKNKEIIVLDHKRSNAINIAMTKLPPPRAIKAAILKMDSTVVTREGIEKLLNMLPTDEERCKIQEAQMLNPELPLGTAEQFLLTLSSISELGARLKLWAFKLDFENIEKEIAEPLMDLKQGVETLKANLTFKCILSTLLNIGIFLNGAPVKGFQIEYLAKVPEVKDTVHKHSLLHHLCHMVMESQVNTTDLYSEIGAITRASKADFNELAHNITYLEAECKASWDRLKLIGKHDMAPHLKQKLIDFLADCAERIIILDIVHRRVLNRYRKFLLWLGVPQLRISESRPNEFCRIVSEFALEYRTTRERVQQQIEKKANHRERNKTRGKLIVDVTKLKTQEDLADNQLRTLLGIPTKGPGGDEVDMSGTLTWRRRRGDATSSPVTSLTTAQPTVGNVLHNVVSSGGRDESFTDGDDEILESLVKTATKTGNPRPMQRERKRTRQAVRKSFKRSRTREGFTMERTGSSPPL